MTYPLTSTDSHSPNMLMRNIRREIRAAGCYPWSDASKYVVRLGPQAYAAVCDWLKYEVSLTVSKVRVELVETMANYGIKVVGV